MIPKGGEKRPGYCKMTPCFIVKSYMNRSNNKGVIQLTANLKCTARAANCPARHFYSRVNS